MAIALAGVSLAGAEKPVDVHAGTGLFVFNAGLTPKTLPRVDPAPVSLRVSAEFSGIDGPLPPPLRVVKLEVDKNVAIDVSRVPVCRWGQLQSRDTDQAKKICEDALVGDGEMVVFAAYPENVPIPLVSEMLVFNGGFRNGVTTLFVHAHIVVPRPAAIVIPVKIEKISHARYGTLWLASIPRIDDGYGHVTSFDLGLGPGILTAQCPDGRLGFHANALFEDESSLAAETLRTCVPRIGRGRGATGPNWARVVATSIF